ncbi:MAG: dihydropteroate synthase [Candidatus Helarchaeota archaeon]|nr:dihydropteroate synthase [Candidatus Helarchaeota archaeon]
MMLYFDCMQIQTTIAGIPIGDTHPVRLMGVINLSPESFYEGSVFLKAEEVLAKAKEMIDQGCDIIDIGGRSTAPGVAPISVSIEKERVLPVLKALLEATTIPISVDTQYAVVAEEALKLGCQIINDVSGLNADPQMVSLLGEYDCPIIIMATQKVPGDCLTMPEINEALSKSIKNASTHGINPNRIIVDPGIGKWISTKLPQYNLEIINQLQKLRKLGKPILVGISRKSFIGEILQKPQPADRLTGSLAATAIAVYNGAHLVRTHDVGMTRDIIRIAESLRTALTRKER